MYELNGSTDMICEIRNGISFDLVGSILLKDMISIINIYMINKPYSENQLIVQAITNKYPMQYQDTQLSWECKQDWFFRKAPDLAYVRGTDFPD